MKKARKRKAPKRGSEIVPVKRRILKKIADELATFARRGPIGVGTYEKDPTGGYYAKDSKFIKYDSPHYSKEGFGE